MNCAVKNKGSCNSLSVFLETNVLREKTLSFQQAIDYLNAEYWLVLINYCRTIWSHQINLCRVIHKEWSI